MRSLFCLLLLLFVVKNFAARHQHKKKLPCDNFICLLEKFEIITTKNGLLLKRNPIKKRLSEKKCKDFQCWFSKFSLKKTSYGFEMTHKKSSTISTTTQTTTTSTTTTITTTISTTTSSTTRESSTVNIESTSWNPDIFYEYFYK